VLAVYAFALGPGAVLMGIIPSAALVSRWFSTGRGKALGVANMPLFILVIPPVAASIVLEHGHTALFAFSAVLAGLLVPALFFVVDYPKDRNLAPYGERKSQIEPESVPTAGESLADGAAVDTGSLFRDARFWLLSISVGVLLGGGTFYTTHIIGIAAEKGIPLQTAAALLSLYGVGTILGAVAFGWLADRIGLSPLC